MSRAYSAGRKNRRRALDQENPERKRVRRMIKQGKLPSFFFAELGGKKVFRNGYYTDKEKKMPRVYLRWPLLKSTFVTLTHGPLKA